MPTTTVLDQLTTDMKLAMKAGEKEKLGVIRMLISEARTADLQTPKATPDQMIERYARKLVKSAEEFAKVGRDDEVAKLKAELAIAETYMPKKKSPEDTEALVTAYLAANPALTAKELGKATGGFMKQYNTDGDIDASIVNQFLRSKLV